VIRTFDGTQLEFDKHIFGAMRAGKISAQIRREARLALREAQKARPPAAALGYARL
jgi:hypothetical protein